MKLWEIKIKSGS